MSELPETPPAADLTPSPKPTWYKRRWVQGTGAAVIVLGIIGAISDAGKKDATSLSNTKTVTVTNATPTETAPDADAATQKAADEKAAKEAEAASQRAEARAARGVTFSKIGSQVVTYQAERDDVAVVKARNAGSSNFLVEFLSGGGGSGDLAINEIGPGSWAGVAKLSTGRYKVKVTAEGSWSLTISQPLAKTTGVKALPGALAGKGSAVIPINVPEDLPAATIAATNNGDSNFLVEVVGYGGETTGSSLIVNEIGPGSWSTASDIPAGSFLLKVTGAGNWTLKIAP